ncbi:ankyrin repeat family protein, partial [Trifolium medium]|nr:ankyrin repeat family protein [Trifolium medium]
GQAAVITPRQVTTGLGSRRVMAIAAAKHHTVIATQGGEVFTWGSNRGKTCRYLTILMFILSLVLYSVTVNYFTGCN